MEELDGIAGGSAVVTVTPWTNEDGTPCVRLEIKTAYSVSHFSMPASRLDQYKERHPDYTFRMSQQ